MCIRDSSPGDRTPEEEARVSAEQSEAAQKALAESAAREARIAAEQAAQATPVVDRPSEVEADDSGSTESSETSADDTNEN